MDELTFTQPAAAAPPRDASLAPQAVRLRRFVAAIVDLAATFIAAFLIVAVIVKAIGYRVEDASDSTLTAFVLIACYVVSAGRAAFAARSERRRSGQTIGRWLVRIRTANPDGSQPTLGRAALHTVVPTFIATSPLLLAVLDDPLGRSGQINGALILAVSLLFGVVVATALATPTGSTFYDRLLGVRTVRRPESEPLTEGRPKSRQSRASTSVTEPPTS